MQPVWEPTAAKSVAKHSREVWSQQQQVMRRRVVRQSGGWRRRPKMQLHAYSADENVLTQMSV